MHWSHVTKRDQLVKPFVLLDIPARRCREIQHDNAFMLCFIGGKSPRLYDSWFLISINFSTLVATLLLLFAIIKWLNIFFFLFFFVVQFRAIELVIHQVDKWNGRFGWLLSSCSVRRLLLSTKYESWIDHKKKAQKKNYRPQEMLQKRNCRELAFSRATNLRCQSVCWTSPKNK